MTDVAGTTLSGDGPMAAIRMIISLAALSLPFLPADVGAAPPAAGGDACAAWLQVPIPAADIGAADAGCGSGALYDGPDGTGGDPVAARHCAYRERATAEAGMISDETVFGGSGVLTMLYANGQGVPRDLDLARRFACEYGGAPAELRGRLAHLQGIADGTETGPLHVCDDITSGLMAGFCAGRAAGFARHARNRDWRTLQAGWTPAQREAWRALRAAADTYFGDAAREEVDLSGTARSAIATQAREDLETALLDDVRRFEHGQRPASVAGDLEEEDRRLNATYRDVLAQLRTEQRDDGIGLFGTVTADGVRTTQRAWLRYREAWVRLAAARWPGTAADAWRAWLTQGRTTALRTIVDGA